MAKISIVIPPIPEGVLRESIVTSPPLNAPYLAAISRSKGHEIKVIDCPALNLDHTRLGREISSFNPDLIGITSLSQTYPTALKSAATAKDACPNALVVLGGPHATFLDKETLGWEPGVDVVVRKEGEQTILDLARNIGNSKKFKQIPGITYRSNNEITRTPDRPFIKDLDSLPFPAYDLIPLGEYSSLGRKIFCVLSSRGCPYKCTFCVMRQMDGSRIRTRSAENVVDEIEYIKELGADNFSFCDETFTFNEKRVLATCSEIRRRKINLPWDCQTRVDRVSKQILSEMKRAGCQNVGFGIESGSQKILDAMRKGNRIEQFERAVRLAKKVGLTVIGNFMLGYLNETKDTIKQTLHFIKKVQPDIVFLNIATPFPGTEFYDLVKNLGWKLSTDWKSYDIVTPVFENPELSSVSLLNARKEFYEDWYSIRYFLKHFFRRNFYSRIIARFTIDYKLRRLKQKFSATK